MIFNVVTPTLTVYLPERTKATGTGIIIAPGGAFVALAMDVEARDVALWLQSKGIAAFILKYRIIEKHGDGIPDLNMDEAGKYGIADGVQAVKVVRAHAREWGISQDRVGFMGFSAGAMVASGAFASQGCRCTASNFVCSNLWFTVWSNAGRSNQDFRLFSWLGRRTTRWQSMP